MFPHKTLTVGWSFIGHKKDLHNILSNKRDTAWCFISWNQISNEKRLSKKELTSLQAVGNFIYTIVQMADITLSWVDFNYGEAESRISEVGVKWDYEKCEAHRKGGS